MYFKDYRPISTDARLIRPPEILLTAEEIKLAGRSGGEQMWRVDAKRLTLSQNRMVTTLEDIHSGAIYEKGEPTASVKAGRAVYNSFSQRFDASGGVRVTARDGTTFQTSRVSFDGLSRKLVCPVKVTLVRGETQGSVDRLVADLAQDSVEADNLRMRTTVKEIEELQEERD